MCIRDSIEGMEQDADIRIIRAVCPLSEMFGYVQAIRGLSPVSYTHLRAHETVLDLVCRLLLEKKIHKHSSTLTIIHITISTYARTVL